MEPLRVALEIGKKRVFACTVDWPGYCRGGRDAESAFQALLAYGSRYTEAMHRAGIAFQQPAGIEDVVIVERVEGNPTTDFGAPDAVFPGDAQPVTEQELEHFQSVLKACWQALEVAAQSARGKELSKGPRGGGRDLESMLQHVQGAEAAYLSRLGRKAPKSAGQDLVVDMEQTRAAILEALDVAVRDGLPEHGPRGGKIWPTRFFVRRVAWHVLDHAWEIQDRLEGSA